MKFLKRFYMVIIFILLYAPIITLMVLSFNVSKSRAHWAGFTLHWYESLFQNTEIMQALYNTLIIALLASVIATIIGTLASVGMHAMGKKSRSLFVGVTNIPMLNSEIVMGVSLMLLFIIGRMELGFTTILVSHITFNIPYVILNVLPKLSQINRETYEAALDLGATPFYAYRKVVLPDIMPGVISGFLLSFTMSLDDFVITYFTKGPGIDTLSTKIYSEVRKGIRPEMYSLSTILFATILLLLIIINTRPDDKKAAARAQKKFPKIHRAGSIIVRRVLPAALAAVVIFGGIYYYQGNSREYTGEVVVYNFGDYLDYDILDQFEEETGIKVIYEEYETNEIMYPKIKSGAVAYDLVCPSDYMVQKMIENDLLQEINFDNIPNIKYIGDIYMKTAEQFDPGNKYSVPNYWGTVGILYNKNLVDEPVNSWKILWETKYKDSILMQDSVRDAFAVALKYKGYSLNSTNMMELNEAQELLKTQKPLVQAYVLDQARDKMIGNEAALAVIYSGDALYAQADNPDLEYIVPEEGSNVWLDSWVIPANARNKENAEAFLNFLCRPDIALKNFKYTTYSIPNTAARELIEDEKVRESTTVFPDETILSRCETFNYLGPDTEEIYNRLWREVKSQ